MKKLKHTVFYILLVAFLGFFVWVTLFSSSGQAVDMHTISYLESRHTADAFNPSAGERGLFQISPIVLEEWNNLKAPDYKPEHLYQPSVNRQIAEWYMNERIPEMLQAYDIPVTEKNKLWAYNAGIGHVRRGEMPETTERYIDRYYELKEG